MAGSGWFRRRKHCWRIAGLPQLNVLAGFRAPRPVKRRGVALTASSAALVLGAGVMIVAFASPGSHASLVSSTGPVIAHKPLQPATGLQMVSMTPAAARKASTAPAPSGTVFLAAGPQFTAADAFAAIPGNWTIQGDSAVFTPTVGFLENTRVTVNIPGGLSGVVSAAGASGGQRRNAGSNLSQSFTTRTFSTMRLQQLLAQLGYLPLTWTPTSSPAVSPADAKAELAAAYAAPAGTFSWQSGYPWNLTSQWKAGSGNILDVGAIRAFESVSGLTMDGTPARPCGLTCSPRWPGARTTPTATLTGWPTRTTRRTLTIWHNGQVVLKTLANTGIPASPTVDGTFPVYLKFYFSYMKGTNPDGSKYDDPVYYATYFNGGDAVHQFDRYSYGFYQSLGCVELPWDAAKTAYSYLNYGSLVTVTGPVA